MIDTQARLAEMFETPSVKQAAEASVTLLRAFADGDVAAVESLYVGHPDIDEPFHGRGVGNAAREIVRTWTPRTHGKVTDIRLEHFTCAAGHAAAEIAVDYDMVDGRKVTSDVVVVSELDEASNLFVRSRIYYRRAWIDQMQHVRQSVKENTQGKFSFNPVIERYQETLRSGDLDQMVAVFSEDGYLDGHGQSRVLTEELGMGLYAGRDDVRYCLKQMFDIEGHGDEGAEDGVSVGEYIDHRNMFDDGKTTILEFVIVRPNDPNSPEQAGVSAYELGDDGLLGAARIYDEGW